MTPEELERVIERARERYSAMTPADFRRERRQARRGRIRAWWHRPAPPEMEDAAADFMTTLDTTI